MATTKRSLVEQTLAELAAKAEINSRRATLLAADPTYRRVDANMLHETYVCASATSEAIHEMIHEVCDTFDVSPSELGFLVLGSAKKLN